VNTLIYEVNLEIDAAIADAYRAWLREHVAQMLTLPGFLSAQVFEVLDPPPASGRIALCCQYRLCDADALQAYFDHHAATSAPTASPVSATASAPPGACCAAPGGGERHRLRSAASR